MIKFLGYFVIVFETLFIFLFWFRPLRIPLLLIGILFHLGILIIYPIPWFALTVIAVYLLLLPERFWLKLSKIIKSKQSYYSFYYDEDCPLCVKVVVVIKHIDLFNRISCLSVQQHAYKEIPLNKYSQEELLTNIHGVSKKGNVYVGYEAYMHLLKHTIYMYPLGLCMMLPGISLIGKKLYTYIAGERLTTRCTEENCMLPVYSIPPTENQDLLVKGWNKINLTVLFWKTLIIVMFFFQCLVIWTTPFIQSRISKNNPINQIEHVVYYKTKFWVVKFVGIIRHPVFMFEHFYNYKYIYKITLAVKNNNEILLPIINDDGMPSRYISGATWIHYTFNTSYSTLEFHTKKNNLEKGIVLYVKQFINEKKITSDNLTCKIYFKKIEIPRQWQKDFLRNQMNKPWQEAGLCKIDNGQLNYFWNKKMDSVFNNIR